MSKLDLHNFALQALTAHYVLCKISAEAIQKLPMQIKWSLEEDGGGGGAKLEMDDGWDPN